MFDKDNSPKDLNFLYHKCAKRYGKKLLAGFIYLAITSIIPKYKLSIKSGNTFLLDQAEKQKAREFSVIVECFLKVFLYKHEYFIVETVDVCVKDHVICFWKIT